MEERVGRLSELDVIFKERTFFRHNWPEVLMNELQDCDNMLNTNTSSSRTKSQYEEEEMGTIPHQ